MKIYFEDSMLVFPNLYNINYVEVDAKYGPSFCIELLDKCRFDETVDAIYTNFVDALATTYSWNSETKHIDIFLRHPQTREWISIDKFTDKELRPAQHIPHMYRAGVFSKIEEN